MATPNSFWQQSRGKGGLDQMARAGKLAPVGTTPYVAGLASYKPMETYQSGRSRLDPARIAGKMARGNARPGEIAAAQLMQRQQAFEAELPITQAKAEQAKFSSSLLADPEYQDVLRKKMTSLLEPEEQKDDMTKPSVAPLGGQPASPEVTMSPMTPEERAKVTGGIGRNPAVIGTTRAEGGEMEMEMEDEDEDEDEGGGEDAFLLGEKGPEMIIKRDDGSMFVLPADVTKKIMSGITMEDTDDNQDAMAAAMQRMGMEVAPKMCGGKMKPRMGGGMMKPYMNGGTMMAQETGRMAPATSRTKTRKNVLFDAMKRLV